MKHDESLILETPVVAKKLIEAYWQFGIANWVQRNQVEHGNHYSVSVLERERVQLWIREACIKFGMMSKNDCEVNWMFGKSIDERLSGTYDLQLVWLELLRKRYIHHKFEWFNPDSRMVTYIKCIEEGLQCRSLSIW